ncbi:hypothetical protein FRB94_002883 [Tulasnella sp. JGI-2019a]|nr:hypothetical protein FRB94_002883 [Tulasnella sp. JGI-2019a]KAG9004500.1 hypothetical protein FRB93_010277 [Tulasnella sp. JGI-2019a]
MPPPPLGAVRVRSFSIVPVLQISLRDVLEGKHLPPLSVADFEAYLRFVERSVENMYFIHWLDDYTTKYQAQMANAANTYSPSLALSFARAKATFLSPQSHLAVNINDDSLSAIIRPQDETKSIHTYPAPERFTHARREVEDMLRNSLTTFVTTRAQGNVCVLHLLAGLCFGIVCLLCGVTIILSQISQHPPSPRRVRLAATPFLFAGFCAFIGCWHGVCIIVWMFGDGRQLRDYELERPEISGVVSHTTMIPLQEWGLVGVSGSGHAGDGKDGKEEYIDEGINLGYPLSLSVASTSATGISIIGRKRLASPSPSTQSGLSSLPPTSSPAITVPMPSKRTPSAPTPPIITSMHPTNFGAPADDQPLTSISLVFDPSDPSSFTSSPSAAPIAQQFPTTTAPGMIPDEPPPPLSATRTVNSTSNSNSTEEPQRCYHEGRTVSSLLLSFYRELNPAPGDRRGPRPRPFAPMTLIESSVIRRSNWEVVTKVVAISAILTSTLISSLWFVPTHTRS